MVKGVEGGYTLAPGGETVSIYDAAMDWMKRGVPLVILAGREYGTGSSRDWAGKGPMLQGVKMVIAESYERIHRSNLIGMGILPLEFAEGGSADAHGLNGGETFSLSGLGGLRPGTNLEVQVQRGDGTSFGMPVLCRIDTPVEMDYWKSGGILNYVLRNIKES